MLRVKPSLSPKGDKMANVIFPSGLRAISKPPQMYTKQQKHKVQNFFLQEKSLLLDRSFSWKSAKDFEAETLRTGWAIREPGFCIKAALANVDSRLGCGFQLSLPQLHPSPG